MKPGLTRDEVKRAVEQAEAGVPYEECLRCDCFHGFVTQLEMDAVEGFSDFTARLIVPQEEIHGCLGCDPCPPGSLFAEYI